MCFELCSVQRQGDHYRVFLRRLEKITLVEKGEKELLSGAKYYYLLFSDGTAKYGRYGSDGKWKSTTPEEINDFFDFSGESRFSRYPVFVDGDIFAMKESVYAEVCKNFQLEDIFTHLKETDEFEYYAK